MKNSAKSKPLPTRRQIIKGLGAAGLGLSLSALPFPALKARASRPIRFLNTETGRDTEAADATARAIQCFEDRRLVGFNGTRVELSEMLALTTAEADEQQWQSLFGAEANTRGQYGW